jgi:peptidoglycan/LPS O-acetylase OafA/YrhL
MSVGAVTTSVSPADRPGGGERVHLRFLDGLRGVAALYVVFHHFLSWSAQGVSRPLRLAVAWTQFGHFTVDVFIVLSGFSLMLPVATAGDRSLRGGTRSYFKRRARRILPPYYAAMALSVLVLLVTAWWSAPAGHAPHARELPADLSAGSTIAHLLLLHNLHEPWNMSINMAHWSVATEWQIYFLFPLLLLPVWRRWGVGGAVGAAMAIGMTPHFLLPEARNLDWACPWFLGLFAMGMAVASCFAREPKWSRTRTWLAGAIGCTIAYVATKVTLHGAWYAWTRDVCAGALAACVIGWCATSLRGEGGRRPLPVRLLEARPCVALGAFSYSLYLTHCAVLQAFAPLTRQLRLTADAALLLRGLVGIPAAVAIAYGLYLAFERPFLARRATIEARTAAPPQATSAAGAAV